MFGHSGLAYAVLSFLALHSVLHNRANYIGSYPLITAGICNYLLRLLVFLVGVKQLFKKLGYAQLLRNGAVRFWSTFGCRCGLWPAGAWLCRLWGTRGCHMALLAGGSCLLFVHRLIVFPA